MKHTAHSVTVVLLTYNCEAWIERTLRHLVDLGMPVIVVDNASTDGTVKIINKFRQFSLIALPKNIGAAARNKGVEAAQTEYVAFCDDDGWWDKDGLHIASQLFDTYPTLGLVNARILVGAQRRLDPICEEMNRSPLPNNAAIPGKVLMSFMGGASVVRRRAFLAVGGYDPEFFMGGEEETLGWKLIKNEWEMRYIDQIVAFHYPSLQNAPHMRHYGIRNTIWNAWLHRPVGSALRWTWYVMTHSAKNMAFIKGLLMVIPGIPWVWRTRKVVAPHIEAQLALLDQEREKGPTTRRYGAKITRNLSVSSESAKSRL